MNKTYFMKEAIKEAYKGIDRHDGGPFGCVIVNKEGQIVGRGHNEVIRNNDCTCHGEMMAIRDACANLGTFDLSDCELFTTAQACPMCKGAIQWARIKKVYQGCNYEDTTKIGFADDEFSKTDLNVEELDREDCLELFENYLYTDHKTY